MRSLLAVLALTVPASSVGLAQSSGARNMAMGGTGVASSAPFSAAFVNPALTRFRDEHQGRAFMLPFVSALASDQTELLEAVDDFQDTLDELQARIDSGDPTAAALRPLVGSQLAKLDQRPIDVSAAAGIAALLPMRDFTLTFATRTYGDARAMPFIDPADIAAINDPSSTSADLENLNSDAVVLAGVVSEFSTTLAFEGEWSGRRFSVGLSPKLHSIDVTNYGVGVSDFEEGEALDDLQDGQFQERSTDFNADFGLAVAIDENAMIGLSVQNIFREDYPTVMTLDREFTYTVRAKPTLGVALREAGFTFTADADLYPTSQFEEIDDSQFVRMGFEYDAAGWAQLRAGFAHDLRDSRADTFSFGFGVAAGSAIQFDAVGVIGDHSMGAGIQATLEF